MQQISKIHFQGPFKFHENKNCVFDKKYVINIEFIYGLLKKKLIDNRIGCKTPIINKKIKITSEEELIGLPKEIYI